jgi:hypothetical protein
MSQKIWGEKNFKTLSQMKNAGDKACGFIFFLSLAHSFGFQKMINLNFSQKGKQWVSRVGKGVESGEHNSCF